jgi:hypothetical protein
MSSTAAPIDQLAVASRGSRAATAARLILALAVTFGVLVYAWGRTLLEGVMITGRPKPLYVAMLLVARSSPATNCSSATIAKRSAANCQFARRLRRIDSWRRRNLRKTGTFGRAVFLDRRCQIVGPALMLVNPTVDKVVTDLISNR